MTKSKSVPAIPANWSNYINRTARRYACGLFSTEDAESTASEAFIRARARYVPAKGPFQNYAVTAIRNALLNARIAEQRTRDIPADPNGGSEDVAAPAWAVEEETLRAIDQAERDRAVSDWTDRLPAKYASLYQGLYDRNLSQRNYAAQAGVSQAAVSQRNKRLLRLGEKALAGLPRD